MTPFGNMHVKITVDPKTGRELEVFAQLGKGGDIANSDLEAICRMISLWLRAGGSLRHVIQQLKDIGSSLQVPTREGKIMSLGDGLARALHEVHAGQGAVRAAGPAAGRVRPGRLGPSRAGPRQDGNGNGNGNGKARAMSRCRKCATLRRLMRPRVRGACAGR